MSCVYVNYATMMHVSIMQSVLTLVCASSDEPRQQLQACVQHVASNTPLLKLTLRAVQAACLDAAIPDSRRLLAHYAGCCHLVHHPGATPNSSYHPCYHLSYYSMFVTTQVATYPPWCNTQQLLPPMLPSELPPMLPSELPPNKHYLQSMTNGE